MTRSLVLLLLAIVLAGPARADEASRVDEPDLWGLTGPSPYYPADGLQSPLRDDGVHLGGDVWIEGASADPADPEARNEARRRACA